MNEQNISKTGPAGVLWNNIQLFLMEKFDQQPATEVISMTRKILVLRLREKFTGAVDPEMVADLLKNGYQGEDGDYTFERKDFTPTEKQKREVEP